MAKKEYEKLEIETVMFDAKDILTVTMEDPSDGDYDNYGIIGDDW